MHRLKDITENRLLMRAGGITLGIYLLFAVLIRPDIRPANRPHPRPLHIRHITRRNPAHAPMQALWSPVLFSFPNRQGFSADFLAQDNFKTETPKQENDRFIQFLDTPQTVPETAALRLMSSAEAPLQISDRTARSVFTQQTGTNAGLQLKLSSALSDRLLSQPDLNQIPEVPAGNWQQTATITVNKYGQVLHAFIAPQDSATGPLPLKLVNALYQLKFKHAATEAQGQVRIYSHAGEKAE